jgi:nucleoside-diphosphate-sugar epimerase
MGGRKVPFVYVDNLADALCLIGRDPKASANKIFNVVDGDRVSQRQFLHAYRSLSKDRLVAVYVPLFLIASAFWCLEKFLLLAFKKQVFLNYKLDCIRRSPAHSTERLGQLGWVQRVRFEEGLGELVKSKAAAGRQQTAVVG